MIKIAQVVDDARLASEDALADFGYTLLPLSILIGATFFSVSFIVVGQSLALLILCVALALRLYKGRPPPHDIIWLQIGLMAIASAYLLFHMPEGKYTFITFANAAVLISLYRDRPLPRVSQYVFFAFLAVIYGRLAIGYPTLEVVALHSKNYIFIYCLFFTSAAAIERFSNGQDIPLVMMGATAFIGVVTVSMANILTSGLLLAFGVWATSGVRRIIFLTLFALLVVSNAPVSNGMSDTVTGTLLERIIQARDYLVSLHLTGVDHHLGNFEATKRNPLGDERMQIWADYLSQLTSMKSIMLGGFSDRVDVNNSLHGSLFATHQKFGLFGFALVLGVGFLYLKYSLLQASIGGILLVFMFRAFFDSIVFIGGYFDYALIGVLVAVAAARRSMPETAPVGLAVKTQR